MAEHRLGEVTEGARQIPFVQEKETGKWYHDSDFIVPYFEDKFPERKLGKMEECPQVYVVHQCCTRTRTCTRTRMISEPCIDVHATENPPQGYLSSAAGPHRQTPGLKQRV